MYKKFERFFPKLIERETLLCVCMREREREMTNEQVNYGLELNGPVH